MISILFLFLQTEANAYEIHRINTISTGNQFEISAARTPDGVLAAQWMDDSTGAKRCARSVSRDGGKTWQPESLHVADGFGHGVDPVVAVDRNGTLYMVCLSVSKGFDGTWLLEMTRSANGGNTWSDWTPVGPRNAIRPDKPWLDLNSRSEILIGYTNAVSSLPYSNYFNFSSDSGQSWTADTLLPTNAPSAQNPIGISVVADSRDIFHLVWGGYRKGRPIEYLVTENGHDLSSPKVIGINRNEGPTITSLAIDPTGNSLFAIWYVAYESGPIESSFSNDGGRTWSPAAELSASGSQAAAAFDEAGRLRVIWNEPKNQGIYTQISYDHGRSFVRREQISGNAVNSNGSYQAIVRDGAKGFYAFFVSSGVGEDVFVTYLEN